MPVLAESSTSEEERGRPKLKTKTLDGSSLDDRGLKEASSSPVRRRGWKEGGERGVPSWLECKSYPSSRNFETNHLFQQPQVHIQLKRPKMAHVPQHPHKTSMKHAHIKQPPRKHEPRRKSHNVVDGKPFCLKPEGLALHSVRRACGG